MRIKLDENDDLLTHYDLDFSKANPNRFAEKYLEMDRRKRSNGETAAKSPSSYSSPNSSGEGGLLKDCLTDYE